VADLAKKHQAQMQRAKRAHIAARANAERLFSQLSAEQLRIRMSSLYEEDLIFAYRSLRAEYNRDVGRAPAVRRPKRQGDGDWLDGESEGEPVIDGE